MDELLSPFRATARRPGIGQRLRGVMQMRWVEKFRELRLALAEAVSFRPVPS
jgi:hypothetical protein